MMRRLFAVPVALAFLFASHASGASAQASAPKKIVSSTADLPAYTYPLAESGSDLVKGDAGTFNAFAAKVRTDLDATLANYDIQDRGTLRSLLTMKLNLQLLGNDDSGALQTVAMLRTLQDKPDAKLLTGISTIAIIKAKADTGQSSGPVYEAAVGKEYRALIDGLPYAVVGTRLTQLKSSYETLNTSLLLGSLAADVDPAVAKNHAISGDLVGEVINFRTLIVKVIPVKAQFLAATTAYIAKNKVVKPDIWAARNVSLAPGGHYSPVTVGIWDSGSDLSLFPGKIAADPNATAQDPDDIAFDVDGYPSHGPLMALTPAQLAAYPAYRDYLKGFSDLTVAIDSPDSAAVKLKLTTLTPDQLAQFFENIELYANYAHGTHVAGIVADGDPAARLVVARITFDYHNIPEAPTIENTQRAADDFQKYVDYLKARNVRVVNMSWGGSARDFEVDLEKNGMGKDAADRKVMAAKLYATVSDALYKAIASAPNILFICAAGNSDQNSSFSAQMPTSFKLPNLFAVGAVDQAGDQTSFTSYGDTVLVYADGFEVESYVPGGKRIPLSGTSMASPEVVNLAAKLLALDPALTPAQLTALIHDGATPSEDGRRLLIDPKKTVALLHDRYHVDISAVMAAK